MFVQEVSIEINEPKINKAELIDKMLWFTGTLRKNGQSQIDFDPVYICEKHLVWTTCTLEKTSLLPKNDNIYVKKARQDLENMCKAKIHVKTLGKETEQDKRICRCKKPSSYILWTNLFSKISPLDCGDCGGNVPLYRIPKPPEPGEQEYYSILSWEDAYQSCDRLQMGCGFGERWASQHMQNHDSGLSKQGREVCRDIEERLGVPVYYYLYNYRSISIERDKQRKCPECGYDWLLAETWHRMFDFRCDKCRLVSSITSNSR